MVVGSYREINLEKLKEMGIRGIITDLDNTLVPWNNREVDHHLCQWLARAREMGFSLCIVSNNSKQRGGDLARQLELPAVWKAIKPRRRAFRQALEKMGLPPEQVAVLGDQLFTDVLGGKRLHLYTILVEPISKREFFGTRMIRLLEKAVRSRLARDQE